MGRMTDTQRRRPLHHRSSTDKLGQRKNRYKTVSIVTVQPHKDDTAHAQHDDVTMIDATTTCMPVASSSSATTPADSATSHSLPLQRRVLALRKISSSVSAKPSSMSESKSTRSSSWAVEMHKKQVRQSLKERTKELRDAELQERREQRRRLIAKKKQKEQNEKRAEVTVPINPQRLKKMSRKQLRHIRKA